MKRLIIVLVLVLGVASLGVGHARAGERVSVQPLDGTLGLGLRQQIARTLRGHGFRVITSIAQVAGTGQYLTLARDRRIAAFLSGDIEEHRTRDTVRFLVWNGADGSVLARWEATATPKRLPRAVAKGFWKHLGRAFQEAKMPPSSVMAPAPPLYVNAGDPRD